MIYAIEFQGVLPTAAVAVVRAPSEREARAKFKNGIAAYANSKKIRKEGFGEVLKVTLIDRSADVFIISDGDY